MTLKAKLTEHHDGRVALETPFHAELVAWLRTLPSSSRTWDPDIKRWLTIAGDKIPEAFLRFQQAMQRYLSAPVPERKQLAAGGLFA